MATPAFGDIASSVNDFMAGQAQNQYLKNLPNYANMVGSRTENIGQQLKGQLPQDVINQIGQQAAERGIAGGSPGSPNANAAYLRSLGLNSLQMQQQGNQNLSTAIGDTPVAPLFSPASMIVPNYFGQQELNNSRLGLASGRQQGGGGGYGYAGVSGMPNVGFGGGGMSPDAASFNGPGVSGPSWGTGGDGLLNSRTFTGGVWNGNSGGGSATDNWWSTYGGTNLNSNMNLNPDTGGNYDWGGNSGFGWEDPGGWDSSSSDAADMFLYDE